MFTEETEANPPRGNPHSCERSLLIGRQTEIVFLTTKTSGSDWLYFATVSLQSLRPSEPIWSEMPPLA